MDRAKKRETVGGAAGWGCDLVHPGPPSEEEEQSGWWHASSCAMMKDDSSLYVDDVYLGGGFGKDSMADTTYPVS